MKKIFSAIIAAAMTLVSFSAVANAAMADYKITVTPEVWSWDYAGQAEGEVITEANAGDYIGLYVDFSTDGKGFSAYGINANFDTKVFSYANEVWTAYRSSIPSPSAITPNDNGLAVVGGQGSNISESKAAAFYLVLKIADNATTGEYTFTLSDILDSNGNPNNVNADLKSIEGVYNSVTLKVNGVAASTPATINAKPSVDGDKVEKEDGNTYFTKGLSATLTPGTETVTKVIATLFNKAGKEGNEKAEWEGTYKGETPITFFINVLNVPDGEDVTATWDIVK